MRIELKMKVPLSVVTCPACPWFYQNVDDLPRPDVVSELAEHYRAIHGSLGQGGDRRAR